MPAETVAWPLVISRRVFAVQLVIVIAMLSLVIFSNRGSQYRFDFWLAFLVGSLGSSMALLKKIRQDSVFAVEIGRDFFDTLQPILYGAILAGLTYFLFVSEILSGDGGKGLLTTNLFPRFIVLSANPNGMIQQFLESQPATVSDLGKLMVWCFLAGFSEKFVTGILGQLDQRVSTTSTEKKLLP